MQIFLSLIFFLQSGFVFANCEFKNDVKKIISLSGPATVVLKELNLLKNPKVKGVSIFHPVDESDFKGKFYPGGIFISHSILSEFSGSVVFYDGSRDLERLLKSDGQIQSREIVTRNLLPLEALAATIKSLKEVLTGCDENLKNIQKKGEKIQKNLLSKLPDNSKIVFYLGEIRNDKKPELVMVNDGVVKLLIQKSKIKTYPSELAYVNWASKIMNNLPTQTLHVGIKDTGKEKTIQIKRSSLQMTLFYPGVLVPGLSQLEAFLYLAERI